MFRLVLALVAGLLVGAAAGYALERHHVRGLVDQMFAASIACTGEHRARVLAGYARRLHVRVRGAR
jgi:hypothetical protein